MKQRFFFAKQKLREFIIHAPKPKKVLKSEFQADGK